jgi:hypothetical protein
MVECQQVHPVALDCIVPSDFRMQRPAPRRVRVSIVPLRTERVSVRLGLQLPPDDVVGTRTLAHWAWLIASARGHRNGR